MGWIRDVGTDLRYGLRVLRKQPGFTAVVVATIAFGIGANTAIFTLFDALLLRSLPVREPERLVLFSSSVGEGTRTGTMPTGRWDLFSSELYAFLRGQPLPFDSLAAVASSGASVVSVHVAGE